MFHVIKRFKNGRLWSMQTKGYMTLAQVLQASQTENVFIVDNVSKRDVTTEVLNQHETAGVTQYDTH